MRIIYKTKFTKINDAIESQYKIIFLQGNSKFIKKTVKIKNN